MFHNHPNPGPYPQDQTPPTCDPTEDATERTQHQLADLRELAGLAMKLARRTAEECFEPAPEKPAASTRGMSSTASPARSATATQ